MAGLPSQYYHDLPALSYTPGLRAGEELQGFAQEQILITPASTRSVSSALTRVSASATQKRKRK